MFSLAELTEDEEYAVQNIIASIDGISEPKIESKFAVFTADKSNRYVGIAFDFENYEKIHSFYKNTFYDIDLQPRDAILFYVCKIPEKTREISYRLVIDGVWTTDPLNPNKYYDYEADTFFSKLEVTTPEEIKTEKIEVTGKSKNSIRFIYKGKPNQKIRLGGSFTNWDSYIYELSETSPGFYELTLSLSPGTYYYSYYNGNMSFVDNTNPLKAYTTDGKIASILEVN